VSAGPATARACDVFDRDRQIPPLEDAPGHELQQAIAFDEHARAAGVDHDLGDIRIAQQILNRSEERQDAVQTAHNAPRAACSK
jgi:hypothetical protein